MTKYDGIRIIAMTVVMIFIMGIAASCSEKVAISSGIIGVMFFLNMITVELIDINAKIKK
ncbi:hypothetical protein [Lactiplantibacillus plantarum]|uniref:hypothetical protein n=1 Tax=Lactiplantibacillus plantarum TaxID=1590 RepID=UPI0029427135|nr:hypothetical protein [Lactiplantibacillus plantarum]WOI05872.1 hypothetical protein RI097_15640 [Lactiplantibacillus plantarum]